MKPGKAVNWDKVGGTASTLCAIHCVLTGAAMGFISSFGLEFIGSEWLEWVLFAAAIGAGVFAVRRGILRHGNWRLSGLFAVGMVVLIVRHAVFGHPHPHVGEAPLAVPVAATWLSVVGAAFLIAFHVINSVQSHRGCASCGR